ncbi:attractin-like protein 1 [Styela clava]
MYADGNIRTYHCILLCCIVLLSQIGIISCKCRPPIDLETTAAPLTNTSTDVKDDEIFKDCVNGKCVQGGTCECDQGFKGEYCDECGGRLLLNADSGFVSDGFKDYAKARECSWLIQPASARNSSLRLRFLEFASECGWDYLYIFDGDSAYSPILATFNGLIITQDQTTSQREKFLPEVVATSGSAFLHFFSDVEYAMKGFNISYTIDSCSQDCLGRGSCTGTGSDVQCQCETSWTGQACEKESCPSNCSQTTNQGSCSNSSSNYNNMCECKTGYQSVDCSATIPAKEGFWYQARSIPASFNLARASHTSVVIGDTMWIYSGIQFGNLPDNADFYTYNLTSKEWSIVSTVSTSPSQRYGHSMIAFQNKLLIFGGRDVWTDQVKDELWEFNITTKRWTNVQYTVDFIDTSNNSTTSPLTLWGHSGNLVQLDNGLNLMIVIFGFHPLFEYSGFVYEYNIDTQTWSRANTTGADVSASYGHSSAWDPVNKVIYIHGGISHLRALTSTYGISDAAHSYDPENRIFKVLRSSGVPRYLHSGVLISGVMFAYGGCTHNDSDKSTGALCFSPSFMAYHISCDTWEHVSPSDITNQPNRYGHIAVSAILSQDQSESMIIQGGYDSTMINNILIYQTASCAAYSTNETNCTGTHHNGISCVWNSTISKCTPAAYFFNSSNTVNSSCESVLNSSPSYCDKLISPESCINAAEKCMWCNNKCRTNCENPGKIESYVPSYCKRFRTCSQCQINPECQWVPKDGCVKRRNNETLNCGATCGSYTSCYDCTVGKSCMWCANRGLCVSTTSYVVQFPYGECMKWENKHDQCEKIESCNNLRTCDTCQENPFCGWCDDGSETGLGTCQSGSAIGSKTNNVSLNVVSGAVAAQYNSSLPVCPAKSWFFTDCPLCQCNGHSTCVNETSECEFCQDNTDGKECEQCIDGYYGEATNGGTCKECECFDRATLCNNTTGDCFCSTKGMTGPNCEKCENSAKYYGDPVNNGTCFYRLLINYSFTFTLTPSNDKYITSINFENTPPTDGSTELSFESREKCNIRLTVYSYKPLDKPKRVKRDNTSQEVIEYEGVEVEVTEGIGVTKFGYYFSGSTYGFGDSTINATIRIYVSNFTVPSWIQVSLVQRNNSLLVLLLILFSCFLVLLLLTALVWKLKMLYDACQFRRQRAEQLEQMAARPFGTVHLCFEEDIYKKANNSPGMSSQDLVLTSVTEELCSGGHASAVSVILWMPQGIPDSASMHSMEEYKSVNSIKEQFTNAGTLAIGSALMSSSQRSLASEIDMSTHDRSGSVSKARKLKVVFKRGGRRRTTERRSSQRTTNDPCGTQHHNQSNNRDNDIPVVVDNSAENRPGHAASQPTRQRSKRGPSFTSLRSRSVSPTGSAIDNRANEALDAANETSSSATRSNPLRPHPIILAFDNPNDHVTV